MKYGYVYVGISVAIVVIGIFLIYELGLKQETLQNKDELQHLQTTEMNDIYKPTVTEDQAIQIVKSDLSKHLPNLNRTLIVGKDFLPFNPNYPKYPLQLIFVLPNGTQLLINDTDYSVRDKCNSKDPNAVCIIRGNEKIQDTSGKLVYIVEALWYTKTDVNDFTDYFIDAHTGDILYSNLLENSSYCNSMEETKLFYSQFNLTLKFPQYLPDHYRYKCSVFETSDEAISFYDNRDISLNPPRSEIDKIDFYKNGGLYFEHDRITPRDYYSVLSSIENRTIPHQNFNYSENNGNPAIMNGGMYPGSDIYINSISVYTKDSFSKVEGNLTMIELKKIAESIR